MVTEYTGGALSQALSKQTPKENAAEGKKPLENLFAAAPVKVTFVPCPQPTSVLKTKKKGKRSATEAEVIPPDPQKKPSKRSKLEAVGEVDSSEDEAEQATTKRKKAPIPRDPDQEARTVFVGNLPNSIKMKKLEKLFKTYGEVESVRIRSVAVADPDMPRKLAVIRRDFHPERMNMNAYVRFKTVEEARAALALNAQTYEGFCLRVDMANREKQHDQKKSVFLGNLPFSIEENTVHSFFSDCGEISGVRLVRDWRTGLGKGIGYVQFQKSDAVGLALNLDGSQLAGRKIRVSRSQEQTSAKKISAGKNAPKMPTVKNAPKKPSRQHHHSKETLPPGADRITRMKFFSGLKTRGKPESHRPLKRKAARRIANGKKNRKVTDRKINNGK